MTTQKPKKEKNFYYKIFLAVLVIEFLNLAYLFYRHMSGDVSFYFFRLSERTIFIILSLIAMPLLYILIFLITLVIKKTNKNLLLCAGILSLSNLAFIHTQTLSANYNYKQEKRIEAMNLEYFKWEGSPSSPTGYPIDVYEGGFESKDGGYVGLDHGTDAGPWGLAGGGMSSDSKAVPHRLNATWLSYAEDTFYHIDCPIDYDKMVRYFKEGFEERESSGSGKTRHETYYYIVAGFAPGGVVVIWLSSATKQIEIGRYQGKKIVIDPAEIKGLEAPKNMLFKQSYRDATMNDENIVPTAVREANKDKPIPYGLWDTYREKYLWKPTFVQDTYADHTFTMIYARLEMYNGEVEDLFKETLVKDDYTQRATLKRINFAWKDEKGQVYSGTVALDEKTIFDAFKEISQDSKNGKIEIEFMVTMTNTFVVMRLRSGDKWIFANKNAKVDVFESDKKYNN